MGSASGLSVPSQTERLEILTVGMELAECIGDLSSTDVATGECSDSFRKSRFSGIYCTVTVTVPVFVMAPEVAVTVMM
jgi:hypothetical protein